MFEKLILLTKRNDWLNHILTYVVAPFLISCYIDIGKTSINLEK